MSTAPLLNRTEENINFFCYEKLPIMKVWEFLEFTASKLKNAGAYFQDSMLFHTRQSGLSKNEWTRCTNNVLVNETSASNFISIDVKAFLTLLVFLLNGAVLSPMLIFFSSSEITTPSCTWRLCVRTTNTFWDNLANRSIQFLKWFTTTR